MPGPWSSGQSTKHLCYESHECDDGREYVKAVRLSDEVSILKRPGCRAERVSPRVAAFGLSVLQSRRLRAERAQKPPPSGRACFPESRRLPSGRACFPESRRLRPPSGRACFRAAAFGPSVLRSRRLRAERASLRAAAFGLSVLQSRRLLSQLMHLEPEPLNVNVTIIPPPKDRCEREIRPTVKKGGCQ